MKKHRWIRPILIGLFILVVIVSVSLAFVQAQLDKLKATELQSLDLSRVQNGTYEGSYTAFPVSVKLTVTVKDHAISSITILKHDNGQGKPAEVILSDVIEQQSLQVDVISGATYSSKVILLAIQDALK